MLKKIPMIAAVVIALQSGPISASTLSDDAGQAFQDNRLDWLMHPDMLQSLTQGSKGDPDALRFIADLFAKGDERAVTALQNYMDRFPRDAAAFHIAGTDLLRKGDYEVAVIAFEKALVLDPTADWAVSKMGVAQILNDDVDAGVRTLKRAIKFQPDNPLTLRYLSWAAMRQGDVAEAIMHSERALKAFGLPGDRVNQAHLDLATLYRQTGQYGKVSELLRAAVDSAQLDVSDNTALQVYGMYFEAQLARGNAAEARRAIEKFRPMVDASHPEVLLSEARLMTLEGRQNEAVEVLEAAMQDTRIEGDLLVPDLAKTLASADRLQDALAEIDAAMSHDARPDASLALLRVQLLSDAARETEAIAYLEGLLTDGEDRPDLELMLAEVHLRNGDFAIAEEKAVQAAVRLPQDTQALYTAALAATAQDDDVQAEAYLRQAIDVNPEETRLWLTLLGVVHGHDTYAGHESAEEHAQVEALLNEAIEINPGNVELRYELGLLKLSDGRVEEAIEAFDGALERVPSHTPSLTLGALARADIGQDLETARRMVTLTSFMVPENGVLQDILGWVEHAEGNSAQAVETLTNALVMEPDDVTIRYHLAAALEAVGELESAGEYYISALRGDMYAHYSSGAREA
ncbi:MAG: tetratricopeptide repeat protein, partial [Pseudomonadota bacterium]